MATSNGKGQWHPNYWNETTHGRAWDRVKEALKRDWSQTKADFHVESGKQLRQGADDTVKQAAGSEPIPPPNQANPPDFDKVEPAVAYGFGAHEEYGQKYSKWDDKLETKLSEEWNATETGMKFHDVKPYIRRGWDYPKENQMINVQEIKPEMPVVCSKDGQFGVVDHMEGKNSIKLKKDKAGKHHFIPVSWVTTVDAKVHVDRPGEQAMKEWRTEA